MDAYRKRTLDDYAQNVAAAVRENTKGAHGLGVPPPYREACAAKFVLSRTMRFRASCFCGPEGSWSSATEYRS